MPDDQRPPRKPAPCTSVTVLLGYEAGRRDAIADAVAFLRRYADAHAGMWVGMEPREAIKTAAQVMEEELDA